MFVECYELNNYVYVPSPLLSPASINLQHLNLNTEADSRKKYEKWRIHIMEPKQLAAAGFYFTNQSDLVRCFFCGVEMGHWEEGDDVLKEH